MFVLREWELRFWVPFASNISFPSHLNKRFASVILTALHFTPLSGLVGPVKSSVDWRLLYICTSGKSNLWGVSLHTFKIDVIL